MGVTYMDTSEWKKLWNESQSGSFFEKRGEKEKEWSVFWDEKSAEYLKNVKSNEKFYRDILRHLRSEGCYKPGDNILDIACGPGTYSLLFAENAKSVSSLDISRGMLSELAGEAKKHKLANITPILMPWEKYEGTEKYDLVFTALSPAITGPDLFLKMEKSSRRSCCYIAFGDDSFTGLRNELWKLITGKDRKANPFNISIPFGMLMSMGRKPNVKFFDNISLQPKSVEEIISTHVEFLKTFAEINDEKMKQIREYVKAKADSGTLEYHTGQLLVALYWNVPKEEQ